MSTVIYQKDENQIVHFMLDRPDSTVNLLDWRFCEDFKTAVGKLSHEVFKGVIIRSSKSTFFAGGDIDTLYKATINDAESVYQLTMQVKQAFRVLETLGKPVVACINGSALGGGFETALACTARIAVNKKTTKLGFPEVTLGLLPGAGGVTRMVRHLGVQAALPFLAEGRLLSPENALKLKLVDSLVDSESELTDAAIHYILNNPGAVQPWDDKDFKLPGGAPNSPKLAPLLVAAPAAMRQKTRGNLPAPEAILAAVVEGASVDFATASKIESRYFVALVTGQVSKNLINTFWYQKNAIGNGMNRPNCDKKIFHKVGVLGAGMMGGGIAYSAATKGIDVVLKDVSLENAEKGKDYSRRILDKKVQNGHLDQNQAEAILARIQATDSVEQLNDCELVVEAVYEDRALKEKVTQEAEAVLTGSAVFGSNTSTLPISGLASASKRPKNFIGIHFFSPVDKMPLIEIICGEETSEQTLAKAYDFSLQLGKTPIVVNDSRGFFTSRVFSCFVKEGVKMLRETCAAEIENAAWEDGFPVGPLAVLDEVSLSLFDKISTQTQRDFEAQGQSFVIDAADEVVKKMLELERAGRVTGAGFYQYESNGKKRLWPKLKQHFNPDDNSLPYQDIKDRLLYIMSLETVKCLDEKVLRSVGDANIGSVMGIGFPQWTGGALQFINSVGIKAFTVRATELSTRYGERFMPCETLRKMADNAEQF